MDMSCTKMIMKMQMTFYNDSNFMLFLYDWHVQTTESYIYSLVLLFLFAIVVEFARLFLNDPLFNKHFSSSTIIGNIAKGLAKSLVFFLVISGCYLLMLAVMTYSTGVFIVVCAGSATGYMIGKAFEGSKRVRENEYSLHSIKR